jgi:hypothetical protein
MLAKGLPWPLFGELLCKMALKSEIIPAEMGFGFNKAMWLNYLDPNNMAQYYLGP